MSRRASRRRASGATALCAAAASSAIAATAAIASGTGATAEDPAVHGLPQVHYMLHCQGCHLEDGRGSAGKVPPLRGALATYLTIPEGRAYVVRVPGVSQSPLDDADLAAVLNWAALRFGPADAAERISPYTADEVARARRPALTDVTRVRSDLRRKLGLDKAKPPSSLAIGEPVRDIRAPQPDVEGDVPGRGGSPRDRGRSGAGERAQNG